MHLRPVPKAISLALSVPSSRGGFASRGEGCARISGVNGEVTRSALESARAAFERGEFAAACELYEHALAEERSAEALDGLGEAQWLSGEIDGRRDATTATETPSTRGAR
jgi:hypothetical protein